MSLAKAQLKLIVIALVTFFALIASVVLALSFNNTARDKVTQVVSPQFKNWLAPQETLKIGEYRAVSPCSVLPENSVTSIIGELPSDSRVFDTYLDRSLSMSQLTGALGISQAVETECWYYFGYKNQMSLRLKIIQVAQLSEVRAKQLSSLPLDVSALSDAVSKFSQLGQTSGDQVVKRFLARLQSSMKRYEAIQQQRHTSEDLSLDGLVLPNADRFTDPNSIVITDSNQVVTLTYAPAKDATNLTTQQLGQLARLYDVVARNLADKNLSQSPSPTIRDNTDHVGETRVLEPCHLLSAQVFQVVTGTAPNSIVKKQSIWRDLSVKQFAADKSELPPSNQCERMFKASSAGGEGVQRYGKAGYMTATLGLKYYTNSQVAKQAWTRGYTKADKKLTTKADESFVTDGLLENSQLAFFRYGPYIGNVSFDEVSRLEVFGESQKLRTDEGWFVTAINSIVDAIKTDAKL